MAKTKKAAPKKAAKKQATKKKVKYQGEGENVVNDNGLDEFEGLTEEQKISNIVNHKSAE